MQDRILAGIETGGTKILARLVRADGATLAEGRWPTGTPDTALAQVLEFIDLHLPAHARLAGVGIASFGPLVVDREAPDCGRMLQTPKPGWSGSNLRAALSARLGVPVAIDTDVNAAALAEQRLGAGRGLASVAYVTVGTGVGGGLAIDGHALGGAGHPEIGHIALQRAAHDDAPSACPFHPDCAEGLVAGPALAARLGPAGRLEHSAHARALVADYLGQLGATLVLAWSPQRIVWGGGVMGTPGLIGEISAAIRTRLAGYGASAAAQAADFCVPAVLRHAGLEGALLMARDCGGITGAATR